VKLGDTKLDSRGLPEIREGLCINQVQLHSYAKTESRFDSNSLVSHTTRIARWSLHLPSIREELKLDDEFFS
jgi:hypothetical protein